MFDLTNLIPQVAAVKTGLIVGAVVALIGSSGYVGYQLGSKALPEAEKAQQIDFTKTLQNRWAISSDLSVIYVDRIQKVQQEAEAIIKEVPIYVQDTCTLSPGLRLLHDAAAQGHLPVTQSVNDEGTTATQDAPR